MEEVSSEVMKWDQKAPEPKRFETKAEDGHSIGISAFNNGEVQVVEVDEILLCMPTKDCVQFWVTIIVCGFVIILCIIGMALFQTDDPKFQICIGFFGLAWGVLVPSPNASKAFKRPSS